MANITAPQIIIFFTTSLLFTSVVLSWVLLQAFGAAIVGLPFELPNEPTNLDLSDNNKFVIEGGPWSSSSSGRTSTTTDSYIYDKNSASVTGGVYSNTYHIDNPNKEDYSIVLYSNFLQKLEMVVQSDGFRLVEGSTLFGESEVYYYPYEGANQISNANIKTKFTPDAIIAETVDLPIITFDINGNSFGIERGEADIHRVPTIGDVYFGGVGSKNNIGLTLTSYISGTSPASSDGGGWSELWNFAAILFKILTWGIDPMYLPVEANLLLIKTQEFAIGIGIIGLFWK